MKNKLIRWFEKLKKIAVNRRILIILFVGFFILDGLLDYITYYHIIFNLNDFNLALMDYFFDPLLGLLEVLILVTGFLILSSVFKKSRLYTGLQWILITIALLLIAFLNYEFRLMIITGMAHLIFILGDLWRWIRDPGLSDVASYFRYDGTLIGAFGYFLSSSRLVPLLVYLLPFLRFFMTFMKPKEAAQIPPVRVKKPVWSTFWTVVANLAVYVGCFGFMLFIVVLPGAKTIEGYQPYYELVYLFLALMFVPFIVLGAFGAHHFKRKTTALFKYNLNFVNGMLNIVALVLMLVIALGCFMAKIMGITVFDPMIFLQMGWISLVFSGLLAANVFRILLQNKPVWKLEEEEEAARLTKQAILEQTNDIEHRSPVGLVIPFAPDKPKEDNHG